MIACQCGRCRLARYRHEKERRERFFELVSAVWRGDIRQVVGILASDRTLVDYHGFAFTLPGEGAEFVRTSSIIDYAKVMGHEAVTEVLIGFAG